MNSPHCLVSAFSQLKQNITVACEKSQRNPNDVTVVLATKTVKPERLIEALNAGYHRFGENTIQEALSKQAVLSHQPIEWHFIGHLQRNKVKDAVSFAHTIQSVDRWPLVETLDKQLQSLNKQQSIFIEVNTSGELNKYGVSCEDALPFIRQVSAVETLRIDGLMTIGAHTSDEAHIRHCFKTLKQIQVAAQELNLPNAPLHHLSMGMSSDYTLAIEEGATMIRVGTIIFGPRQT